MGSQESFWLHQLTLLVTPLCASAMFTCQASDGAKAMVQPRVVRGDDPARYGVDRALVRAVIHAESAFRPNVISAAGAQGLINGQMWPG